MLKRLFLLAFILVSGCSAPPPQPTAPTLTPLRIAITPALRSLYQPIQTCAMLQPDTALLVDTTPAQALDLSLVDLAFRLGEPSQTVEFSAPLAWEDLVVILHPENSIRSLGQEELLALFEGRVLNWDQIGGTSMEAQVWAALEGSEPRQLFDRYVLSNRNLSPDAKLAPSPEAMLQAVAADPAAIGYLPRAAATSEVRTIDLGVSQPILALAAEEPKGTALTLLVCLQGESGQDLLQAASYTPWNEK